MDYAERSSLARPNELLLEYEKKFSHNQWTDLLSEYLTTYFFLKEDRVYHQQYDPLSRKSLDILP